eukprot:TRINITY_DN17540_c0_g1_i3.p1 TRINITY_DN17540_c0_g1~~TRINITY_DN17540_c0_g1_i3.p1  ORF type:complete len:1361 (+),score=321.98 TRINITY_DN17540_c0_g1_i3:55-4137(+)
MQGTTSEKDAVQSYVCTIVVKKPADPKKFVNASPRRAQPKRAVTHQQGLSGQRVTEDFFTSRSKKQTENVNQEPQEEKKIVELEEIAEKSMDETQEPELEKKGVEQDGSFQQQIENSGSDSVSNGNSDSHSEIEQLDENRKSEEPLDGLTPSQNVHETRAEQMDSTKESLQETSVVDPLLLPENSENSANSGSTTTNTTDTAATNTTDTAATNVTNNTTFENQQTTLPAVDEEQQESPRSESEESTSDSELGEPNKLEQHEEQQKDNQETIKDDEETRLPPQESPNNEPEVPEKKSELIDPLKELVQDTLAYDQNTDPLPLDNEHGHFIRTSPLITSITSIPSIPIDEQLLHELNISEIVLHNSTVPVSLQVESKIDQLFGQDTQTTELGDVPDENQLLLQQMEKNMRDFSSIWDQNTESLEDKHQEVTGEQPGQEVTGEQQVAPNGDRKGPIGKHETNEDRNDFLYNTIEEMKRSGKKDSSEEPYIPNQKIIDEEINSFVRSFSAEEGILPASSIMLETEIHDQNTLPAAPVLIENETAPTEEITLHYSIPTIPTQESETLVESGSGLSDSGSLAKADFIRILRESSSNEKHSSSRTLSPPIKQLPSSRRSTSLQFIPKVSYEERKPRTSLESLPLAAKKSRSSESVSPRSGKSSPLSNSPRATSAPSFSPQPTDSNPSETTDILPEMEIDGSPIPLGPLPLPLPLPSIVLSTSSNSAIIPALPTSPPPELPEQFARNRKKSSLGVALPLGNTSPRSSPTNSPRNKKFVAGFTNERRLSVLDSSILPNWPLPASVSSYAEPIRSVRFISKTNPATDNTKSKDRTKLNLRGIDLKSKNSAESPRSVRDASARLNRRESYTNKERNTSKTSGDFTQKPIPRAVPTKPETPKNVSQEREKDGSRSIQRKSKQDKNADRSSIHRKLKFGENRLHSEPNLTRWKKVQNSNRASPDEKPGILVFNSPEGMTNPDLLEGDEEQPEKKKGVPVNMYGFEMDDSNQEESNTKKKKQRIKPVAKWEDYLISIQGDFNRLKPSKNLKDLVRSVGIPPDIRGKVWIQITNTSRSYQKATQLYPNIQKDYVDKTLLPEQRYEPPSSTTTNTDPTDTNKPTEPIKDESQQTEKNHLPIKNQYQHQIEIDLPRTFPNNVYFKKNKVQNSLRRILHAYTWHRPDVGYCQSMNFLVAIMLFFVDEEMGFWLLCSIIDNVLPPGYFSQDLLGLRIDVEVFKVIFAQRLPKLSKHFDNMNVEAHSFIYQWFLSLYINVFPAEMAMRFLDCLFYDGSKMLFRVALALFTTQQKALLSSNDQLVLYSLCKNLPSTVTDMDSLLLVAYTIPVSNNKLKEMRTQASIALKTKYSGKNSPHPS